MPEIVDIALSGWVAPLLLILAGCTGWFGRQALAPSKRSDAVSGWLGIVATVAAAIVLLIWMQHLSAKPHVDVRSNIPSGGRLGGLALTEPDAALAASAIHLAP